MAGRNQQWRTRITRYGEEAPDQLLAHPLNWRLHGKDQQAALSGVLDEVGVVQNVIVNERTGHVVDGHLRITLAMRSNQPTVPVTYVDLDESEEALILATLDPIGAMAASDAHNLSELLESVSTGDAAVMALLSELAEGAGVIPADTFDPNAEWQGMPEFHQEDQTAEFQCHVNFKSIEDVEAFERLIGQTIPRNTKSVWYPPQERQQARKFAYVEADADAA